MNVQELYKVQQGLKDHIAYKGKDKFSKMILAAMVEFMECANDWRGFKYWSKRQTPSETKEVECYSCDGKGVGLDYGAMTFWDCETCNGTGVLEEAANPLLEEYVDGLHFVLEIGLDLYEGGHIMFLPTHVSADDIPWYNKTKSVVGQYKELVSLVLHVETVMDGTDYIDSEYQALFQDYLNLGRLLGFDSEDIHKAYMEKNKENHDRQNRGY